MVQILLGAQQPAHVREGAYGTHHSIHTAHLATMKKDMTEMYRTGKGIPIDIGEVIFNNIMSFKEQRSLYHSLA